MYNTVLFPTDGSDGAKVALDHASDIAERYDATLHAVYVAQDEIGPSGMVDRDHEDVDTSDMTGEQHDSQGTGMTQTEGTDAFEKHGQQVVSDVAESVDNVPVETVVLQGNAYERILDYADESDADLIVMGTHGRTGVDRYLLGSVTEKVVRTSDVPVLTVRMGE